MLDMDASVRARTLLIILATLLFTGQSSNAEGGIVKNETPKPPSNLIKIPMTRQSTDYTCGVAALQSVLMYFGDEYREDVLSKDLKADPEQGTAYKEIVRLAESKGYKVDVFKNMTIENLKKLIDSRKPVICLIQAWPEHKVDYETDWEDGHYVVAIGYDEKNVYFMDPSTLGNYTFIPREEFMKRWHDNDSKEKLEHFGMVLDKPESTYDADAILKLE